MIVFSGCMRFVCPLNHVVASGSLNYTYIERVENRQRETERVWEWEGRKRGRGRFVLTIVPPSLELINTFHSHCSDRVVRYITISFSCVNFELLLLHYWSFVASVNPKNNMDWLIIYILAYFRKNQLTWPCCNIDTSVLLRHYLPILALQSGDFTMYNIN